MVHPDEAGEAQTRVDAVAFFEAPFAFGLRREGVAALDDLEAAAAAEAVGAAGARHRQAGFASTFEQIGSVFAGEFAPGGQKADEMFHSPRIREV